MQYLKHDTFDACSLSFNTGPQRDGQRDLASGNLVTANSPNKVTAHYEFTFTCNFLLRYTLRPSSLYSEARQRTATCNLCLQTSPSVESVTQEVTHPPWPLPEGELAFERPQTVKDERDHGMAALATAAAEGRCQNCPRAVRIRSKQCWVYRSPN